MMSTSADYLSHGMALDGSISGPRFLNRELSWLDFNARVLELTRDRSMPLLERVKFLSIFAINLDEFYMVRVGGLRRQLAAGLDRRSFDGMTAREQLRAITEKVLPLVADHAQMYSNDVLPALAGQNINILRWHELDDRQKKELDELFTDDIFPVVTPLAVGPGHPFPYISNLSLNLAVSVRDPITSRIHFARVKVPPLLPRFVSLAGDEGHVPIEDVIADNLDQLFPGMEVVEHHTFRVTRNVDFEVDDDEADDLLEAMEEELKKRRFSPVVRLEVEPSMPDHVLSFLTRSMQVADEDVHRIIGPLGLASLWDLYAIDRADLKDPPLSPVTPQVLTSDNEDGPDIFEVLKHGDVLVHHPYDSFTTSVQRFIEKAALDPDVLAIKQTLYRTSGESPIVDALIAAANSGKQVVVLVEVKARFDEYNNINWARTLERAGCHVVYGLPGLKTHCKLCLVVRKEKEGLKRYLHVGTGNYNPKTARMYEDLGLLTGNPSFGEDASHLFNYLTGYSRRRAYRSFLVAPHGMREHIVSLIEREAGLHDAGRIKMKMNSIVHEHVIDALYEASQAGVQIDLLIRGICSLRPGVPGLSDNIQVRSILGRYLEHSRIFYFGNEGEPEIFIGSADMMHRNLDRRVEALVKIEDADIKDRLQGVLALAFDDSVDSWTLDPKGIWNRVEGRDEVVDYQKELLRLAYEDARA